MSDLSFAEVGEILHLLQAVDGSDVELEWGDLRIRVRRGGPAPVEPDQLASPRGDRAETHIEPADDGAKPPADADAPTGDGAGVVPDHWVAVTAPMAGTFYRAPSPGEAPFVEVGDTVEVGGTVALVEVMKLFTELKAQVAGKVARVDAADGGLVEFDDPLLWIEPA